MLRRHISLLAYVLFQVVQFDRFGRIVADRFPAAAAGCLLEAAFEELPVQELSRRLLFAQQGWDNRAAIDICGDLCSSQFGSGRQEVPKSPRKIADTPGRDPPGPASDGRDTDTALGQIPFETAQGATGLQDADVVFNLV